MALTDQPADVWSLLPAEVVESPGRVTGGPDDEPDQWLVRLAARHQANQTRLANIRSYYRTTHPLPEQDQAHSEAYRLLIKMSRNPWGRLVVDAIAERLRVQGFTGPAGPLAWALWRANRLHRLQRAVHVEALVSACGYVSIGAPASSTAPATIVPESATEMIHEYAAGSSDVVAAALKTWVAADGVAHAYLYTPTQVIHYTADTETAANGSPTLPKRPAWTRTGDDDATAGAHPFGEVPVVPFPNRPTVMDRDGRSELEDLVPVLRRIDKITLDMLLAAEVAGFRQRWATGLDVPKDANGTPVEPFKAAVDRVWIAPKEGARFGSFDSTDLSPFIKVVDACIAEIAAISRVPAHYLLQQNLANPPSADSLRAGESGLAFRLQDAHDVFGGGWERATTLALRGSGVDLAGLTAAATDGTDDPAPDPLTAQWSPTHTLHEAQQADAAVKALTAGVPQEVVWARYFGASPSQIAEWRSLRAADTFNRLLGVTPTAGPVTPSQAARTAPDATAGEA